MWHDRAVINGCPWASQLVLRRPQALWPSRVGSTVKFCVCRAQSQRSNCICVLTAVSYTFLQWKSLVPGKERRPCFWASPCFLCQHSRSPEPWQLHSAHEDCNSLTTKKQHSDIVQASWQETKKRRQCYRQRVINQNGRTLNKLLLPF